MRVRHVDAFSARAKSLISGAGTTFCSVRRAVWDEFRSSGVGWIPPFRQVGRHRVEALHDPAPGLSHRFHVSGNTAVVVTVPRAHLCASTERYV